MKNITATAIAEMDRLAGASVIGAQISDQMNIGSRLASATFAGIQIPDFSKRYPDFAGASVIGAQISDQMNIGSPPAGSAFAGIQLSRIGLDDMKNPKSNNFGLDILADTTHIFHQVRPRSSKLNKENLRQIVKTNDESIVRKEIYDVMKLRNSCNEAAYLRKGIEIFKNTNKASDALLDTMYLIPNDKISFGNFIDNLYVLFYEGAGGNNLRFLKDKGGVLENEKCDFIWCVKHLRNKWLRHDTDHGSESEIKASREALRNAFERLELNKYHPTEPEDFLYLHSELIKELRMFLRTLLEKAQSRNPVIK